MSAVRLCLLLCVENLKFACDVGDHTITAEPKILATDAIIASELVVDPN
jgi:hypothetical protein